MSDFIPVNSLEIALRNMIRDKHTKSWTFYTPLGSSRLWIFAKNYPELDGADRPVPEGQNPEVCVFTGPDNSYIGLYTAYNRAEAAFTALKLDPATFAIISGQGFELLRYLKEHDANFLMNLGLPECQYYLDPDMVDIVLERPAPEPLSDEPQEIVSFDLSGDPGQHLGPLRDFLATQPTVRAAWIVSTGASEGERVRSQNYLLQLLMRDPEDDNLLEKARTMAKALTPVEMEWESGAIMADDDSLRRLAQEHAPFYRAPDFLQ
jgi:hypothetical protein